MHNQLKEAHILLDNLYLDPNNPRYADITSLARPVPEDRVHEEKVQQAAMTKILDDRFGVKELEDSIAAIGFLPVDRLVVVPLPQDSKYMVIEGNRRLAALKSLIRDEESGEIDLSDEIRAGIHELPVLIMEGEDKAARDRAARILQGVRHVSSVRQWGPYQQAQLIAMMLDEGRSSNEIREVLGLSYQRISQLRRGYFALRQMGNEPEFRDEAKPELFSYFVEALGRPPVREWLGWDDTSNACKNDEHRRMFYQWCVSGETDGEKIARKITEAIHIRYLPALMEDPIQFRRFCQEPRLTLWDAYRGISSPEPEIDWRSILAGEVNILNKVPAMALENASESDIELLKRVKDTCDKLLRHIPSVRE